MRSTLLYCLAGSCICLSASCAPFGTSSDLERRVDEQDIQLRQMQPRQADTWNEVQTMRQEINQLKGQLAELNKTGSSSATSPLAQSDGDGPIGTAMTVTQTPVYPSSHSYEPVTGITPSPGNAPESSAYNTTVNVQSPPSASPGSYGLPQENTPLAPSEETWGKADPQSAPPAPEPKKDLALALFEAGENAYNARQYQDAEKSFSDFLKNYSSNPKAAQAQFYLAECKFQRNRFPEAALEYNTVITKYSKSSSTPEALLKQGIAFSKMGQPDAAKKRMQEVISKYPNSPQASRAKNFLKTNK